MNRQCKFLFGFVAIVILLSACTKGGALLSEQNTLLSPIMKAPQDVELLCKVNDEMVKVAALSFIQSSGAFVEGKTVKNVVPITDSLGNTELVALNLNPNGYVVFSADLRNKPIFSYSTDGTLPSSISLKKGEFPDAVLGWMEDFIAFNRWIREYDGNPEDTIRAQFIEENTNEWGGLLYNNEDCFDRVRLVRRDILFKDFGLHPCHDKPSVKIDEYEEYNTGVLLETAWKQGEPYNYEMPVLLFSGGKKAYVGCTAIAVAQIMRYHQYPYLYNWSLMPNEASSSYSNMGPGEFALASFLREVSLDALLSIITHPGTMAHTLQAKNGLTNYYGYSKDMVYGTGFKSDVFENELKNGRPVFLQGYKSTFDAHSFVLDGFKEIHSVFENCLGAHETYRNKYFHYNFGWGRSSDDWYSAYWRYVGKPKGKSMEFTLNLPDEANYTKSMTRIYNIHH